MKDYQPILDFWFNDLKDEQSLSWDNPVMKRWYSKDENFDNEIREKFESILVKASQGDYQEWEQTPKGRLALIILYDQFTRNIYRDTPKMFETDLKALELTLRSLKDGSDKDLQIIERKFLYMPLMHSEDMDIQEKSLKSFESLLNDSVENYPHNSKIFEGTHVYAQKHYDIVKRFARYPHRNAILNRESTQEETKFLKEDGSSF